MPTVLRSGPYRFYFYSHEPNEPPHVHVDRDDESAKFWLESISLARSLGLSGHELRTIEGIIRDNQQELLGPGMAGSDIKPGERVKKVHVGENTFSVDLADGRTITVPYAWYPRLFDASPEQRSNWETCGGRYGIHWPDLDEDLSTDGLLRGAPAPRAAPSAPSTPR